MCIKQAVSLILIGVIVQLTRTSVAADPGPTSGKVVDSPDEGKGRAEVHANLKLIGLAFRQSIDGKHQFPARAIFNAKGESLLSWRVQLLPYLGEGELYKQFHLDEPWDSDHNKT